MFDAFGLDFRADIVPRVDEWVQGAIIHPGFGHPGDLGSPEPPAGEPTVMLLANQNTFRCGVVLGVSVADEQAMLSSASIFFEGGRQHQLALRRILVSKDRTMGLLDGDLDDAVAITLFEPTFASERQWHGEGSVHEVLVYGICYRLSVGAPPPMQVADPLDGRSGKTQTLYFDDAAMLIPREHPPWLYTIIGPVLQVDDYEMTVLDQHVLKVRVVVARLDDDKDVDVDLFVTKTALRGGKRPKVGDMIEASVALCARLWEPNVAFSAE
ncbi:MAG TPA: hypothetical protein PLQ11_05195 [Beijerinckiaceae bacterium]|nr:hypothetical protein [Beijerinckiaceae bacterium]